MSLLYGAVAGGFGAALTLPKAGAVQVLLQRPAAGADGVVLRYYLRRSGLTETLDTVCCAMNNFVLH
jgi:hypothetical protein